MRRRLFLVVVLIMAAGSVQARVVFTSPLPFGILQVHGDYADLRLHVAVAGHSTFSYKLSSDIDTSSPESGWTSISIHNGIVDTLITVPKTLRNYSLYWRTGVSPADTGGMIPGLSPGHIIGIAGQSNAVGWIWKEVATAKGDIRMLTNDSSWQPAEEPTGGVAQGPWIVMANMLCAEIGDSLPIGIVNTAFGGSGLTVSVGYGRWLKDSPNRIDSMYPNAIDRFRHAGSELECLTWIQGETDGEGQALWNPNTYRTQFAQLIQDFRGDLSDSFPVFHLQISGYSGHLNSPWTYPQSREALRILPPSTLVGTALGRSLWDSAFHYTVSTYKAVGTMFAAAILKTLYGTESPMYPPVMPDTIVTLDSITDGNIIGRYCFSTHWTRNGAPVAITSVRSDQYFGLTEDGIPLDTSRVWHRISPKDASRVLVGLRNDSISLLHDWRVTYDAVGSGEHAPLATIDPASGDTIFATAFFELPVRSTSPAPASVKEFSVQFVGPNPTTNTINCYVLAYKHQVVTIELLDNRGSVLLHRNSVLEEGLQAIPISTEGLASGNYWIVLRDENGNVSLQKAILVH